MKLIENNNALLYRKKIRLLLSNSNNKNYNINKMNNYKSNDIKNNRNRFKNSNNNNENNKEIKFGILRNPYLSDTDMRFITEKNIDKNSVKNMEINGEIDRVENDKIHNERSKEKNNVIFIDKQTDKKSVAYGVPLYRVSLIPDVEKNRLLHIDITNNRKIDMINDIQNKQKFINIKNDFNNDIKNKNNDNKNKNNNLDKIYHIGNKRGKEIEKERGKRKISIQELYNGIHNFLLFFVIFFCTFCFLLFVFYFLIS